MRTVTSPTNGIVWRLCSWNEACQVPVSTHLEETAAYCPWHRWCLTAPQLASNVDAFAMWLHGFQLAYPSTWLWGRSAEELWPVVQGVQTVWTSGKVEV